MTFTTCGHTPDVISLARPAVGVLVTKKAAQINVVARVLARLAVDTRSGTSRLVAVQVEESVSNVLLTLSHLPGLQGGHVDGVGGARGTESVRIVDGHALGGGGAGQGREDKGRDACLHLDWCAEGSAVVRDSVGRDGSQVRGAHSGHLTADFCYYSS